MCCDDALACGTAQMEPASSKDHCVQLFCVHWFVAHAAYRQPAACAGDVQSLLETYDKDRRVLPAPIVPWQWGWTKSAETWNGRIAMLALVVILLLEVTTGRGVLNHWPYNDFRG